MLAEFKFGDLQGSNEAHDRDGVFIVRDVLDLDLVGELNRHIDWLIERNPGVSRCIIRTRSMAPMPTSVTAGVAAVPFNVCLRQLA